MPSRLGAGTQEDKKPVVAIGRSPRSGRPIRSDLAMKQRIQRNLLGKDVEALVPQLLLLVAGSLTSLLHELLQLGPLLGAQQERPCVQMLSAYHQLSRSGVVAEKQVRSPGVSDVVGSVEPSSSGELDQLIFCSALVIFTPTASRSF